MSVLLFRGENPAPVVVVRNKTEVIALIKDKAPTKVKRDDAWWAAWLKANW